MRWSKDVGSQFCFCFGAVYAKPDYNPNMKYLSNRGKVRRQDRGRGKKTLQ